MAALGAVAIDGAAFAAYSQFPPVLQDVAVVVDRAVEAAALLRAARDAGGALLRDARVFDVYDDAERLGPGRVSIALRLTFQADDRTLAEDEASEIRERVVAALVAAFGAELRG